jgi:predicted DNA-binding protein
MSRKKVSTTIYITPEQADRLKLLHERTKVPISVYIREGIDMMLKHYEHVLPGQMSLEAAASLPPAGYEGGSASTQTAGSAPAPRPSPKSPAATLRTGSQAGPTRSDDGGA